MKHVAYFGDGEKTFALTMPMIAELERKTGVGIGALYQRVALTLQFHVGDVVEIIRLGLIGGGTSPTEAQSLITPTPRSSRLSRWPCSRWTS